MKITKKVKGDININVGADRSRMNIPENDHSNSASDAMSCAEDHIMKAIEALGSIADTDPDVKDILTNLGVILLDIRG